MTIMGMNLGFVACFSFVGGGDFVIVQEVKKFVVFLIVPGEAIRAIEQEKAVGGVAAVGTGVIEDGVVSDRFGIR